LTNYGEDKMSKLIGWPVAVVKSGKIITRDSFEQVKDAIKGGYLKRQ
jgi:hypothetical protein